MGNVSRSVPSRAVGQVLDGGGACSTRRRPDAARRHPTRRDRGWQYESRDVACRQRTGTLGLGRNKTVLTNKFFEYETCQLVFCPSLCSDGHRGYCD